MLSLGYVIYVHVHIYSIETFIHTIRGICMNIHIRLQFSVLTETPRDNHVHYISKYVIFYEKKKRKKIQLIIVTRFVSTRFISMDKKR